MEKSIASMETVRTSFRGAAEEGRRRRREVQRQERLRLGSVGFDSAGRRFLASRSSVALCARRFYASRFSATLSSSNPLASDGHRRVWA
jgi:hypothetical protein